MKIKILNYIDFNRLNTLLESFNKFTGLVTTIVDLEGNILSKSGWRKICTDFHRVNFKTNRNCITSNTKLINKSKNNSFNVYRCYNGLYYVAVPITINGEHVANLFTGQFFFEKPDIEFFLEQAKKYGFDEVAYIKALNEVPIFSKIQVKEAVEYLLNILQIIIDLTTDKIKQENSKILLESSLESPIDMVILAIDKDYNYLYFNKNYKKAIKISYGKDIEIGMNLMDIIKPNTNKFNYKKYYDLALSGRSSTIIEEYGEDKDLKYFETFYSPMYGETKEILGVTVFAQDITKKIEQENELRCEKELTYKYLDNLILAGKIFENYIINAPIPVIVYAEDGTILNMSKTLTKLTHYNQSDISTIFEWSKKTYYKDNKEKVNFLKIFSKQNKKQHFDEVVVKTKDRKKLVWEFHSGHIGFLPDGRAIAISVAIDLTVRIQKEEKISYLSYHDPLTGLYNRRYYEDSLTKLDNPKNYPLTIVISDINGLKLINNTFGQKEGDKFLISSANIISNSCRKTDLIARIGGDEFIIVMPNTDEKEAEKIINNISNQIKKINVKSIELSMSFGYKTKNNINENIYKFYKDAEDLMYREKLLVLPSVRSGVIETILNALNQKNKFSEIHSRVVSNLSEKIAVAYGMNRQDVAEVKTAGLLHDIGKIIVPTSILTKKGKLTNEEYNIIKKHPEFGFRILNSTHDMKNIANIVLSHHERWDGLGYPTGIKAEEIPLQSRIISIADTFDAMTSERTYQQISTNKEALEEIIRCSGTQFDPKLVQIFKENFNTIIQ